MRPWGSLQKHRLFESQVLNSEAAAQLWSLSVSQPLSAGHLFGSRKCSSTPSSWWVEWLALGLLKLPVAGWVWKHGMRPSCAKGFRANCCQSSLGEEYLKVVLSWTSWHVFCCWPCGAGFGKAVGLCPWGQGSRGIGSSCSIFSRQVPCAVLLVHAGDVFPSAVGPHILPESPCLLRMDWFV